MSATLPLYTRGYFERTPDLGSNLARQHTFKFNNSLLLIPMIYIPKIDIAMVFQIHYLILFMKFEIP